MAQATVRVIKQSFGGS